MYTCLEKRESDVRISGKERNWILKEIEELREDIPRKTDTLEMEMRALQRTVAGLQAVVQRR